MERNLTDKEREMIINFGAFSYDAPKIAAILSWPIFDVKKLLNDSESLFFQLYQSGKHKADYVLDMKLFEMAQGGDMKALNQLEKRIKKED
jgi:hypothetical protein